MRGKNVKRTEEPKMQPFEHQLSIVTTMDKSTLNM